jgi:hypothetical protein
MYKESASMYRLVEFYRTGRYGKPTGRATTFPTLEEARTAAEAAYAEVRRIPESENVFLCVLDTGDRVIHSVPDNPWAN